MFKINLEEIQTLIQKKIELFQAEISLKSDYGKVIFTDNDIAFVYGLETAMLNEMVMFPNNVVGIIIDLRNNYVGVALLNNNFSVQEKDDVYRLKKIFEIPVGNELIGKVINPLGIDLNTKKIIKAKKYVPIEKEAPEIIKREKINFPVETGIKVIDSLLPIGKGQRELIIGDRQTGKTSIALDIILNQKNKNTKCIYVSIGQKNSNVANIYQKLEDNGAMSYTTIVNSSASDSITMQYITPFAAMSIAEEWLENGEDVIVIFDDLSKHAIAYRTLSLLLNRPSGREAYPGDIFYLHSRLLERACKLNKKYGNGSITAIPIIETQNGDITSYIATNIISITDGQIFLATDLFNADIKPAINIDFSVSRIGSNAQFSMMKQVSKAIKISLANYHEIAAFSKFDNSLLLDEKTKNIITRGKILSEYFKQKESQLFSNVKQCINLLLINNGLLDFVYSKKINEILDDFFIFLENGHPEIINYLEEQKTFNTEIQNKIIEIFRNFSITKF
ncbi:MAG: F0F1 ATP synthase subunit alpha [Bacilli bacterium]|nr:F0F1 ATP synthase subunit alpha [Bacilli bacterium]